MADDVLQLACELIDIASTTDDERAIAMTLELRLQKMGFTVRRQEVTADRFNIIATRSKPPRVMLCTHIDTVPPFFRARDEGEFIYGRGACDTKGLLAAMLCASSRLIAEGVEEFGFLLVVGEETDSIGAKVANRIAGEINSEFIVVGEPTESEYVRASKGALTCLLAFAGVAAHSAYPERGDSAIVKLAAAIRDIYAADWGSDAVLGQGTVNVGVVRGGEKANIIPARAEAELIFRTVRPIAEVRAQLESIISHHDGSIVRSHGNDPVRMVVPAGEKSRVVAFNTDVPHLPGYGQPILFGPGSILDAHSAAEKISKKELLASVDTYAQLVRRLLAGDIEVHDQNS